ncbi:hypothetical protein AX16_003915 [Volvariella volvacea WC 439]|nr:hypothetical protein AX16_003915 [Volvariella volvacea WC 439]
MTIKYLESYLVERKHLQTLPLSTLSDSRLGIDASHYLQTLLDNPLTREPLLAATGGLPLGLAQRIEADLRVLEKWRIKPVFVFNGLVPNKRWKQNAMPDYADACRDRRDAWAKYESGQEEAATKLFEGRSCFAQWDTWRMVLRIFRHRNVEFIVAPYFATAQLIYLQRHHKSYIHAIYGATDALLYPGVDKLITAVDFTSSTPTFTFTSKKSILVELGVNEDQLLDIGLLVGYDSNPSFPPIAHDQALKATVDMVKYYKTGHQAVSAFAEHPTVKAMQFPDLFARTRSLIKFALVLSSEGAVQPLPLAINTPSSHGSHLAHSTGSSSAAGAGGAGGGGGAGGVGAGASGPANVITSADVPSDLHEIFTNRLPDEVYFYLSKGLIGPQALVWITSGQIIETPPLDNGETTEYKRFVKEVITEGHTGPRATSLALLTLALHNFWSNRKIVGNFWFEQQNPHGHNMKPIQHNSPQTLQLAERVSGWNVPYSVVEEELRRQNSSTIDFALCLGATASEKLAARTRTKNTGQVLDKKDEVVANVIWRFLELRGFLVNTHIHSPLARAMFTAIRQSRVNDKFQDSLYLFLELVRAGVMHGHLWSQRAFSGGPSFGTDDEKSCMLLVMRVLSIVPLNFKPQPWSAPLSRELLVFNSFVKSLSRALRTLLEVTTLNMLLRSDARRSREDFLDIALSLPFQTEVNTGFGILAKVYLDALTHINNRQRVRDPNAEGVREAKEMALDICEETFQGVKAPKAEVERGFRFWDVCLSAMRQLHSEGAVLKELIDQFEAAEAWLAPMRP